MSVKNRSFFILTMLLFFTSCQNDNNIINANCIQGEGTVTTEILPINSFNKINLAFASSVILYQGATQEVFVTGHPNIIALLKRDVVNGLFVLELEDGCYNNYQLSVHITTPNIEQLLLSGSGDMVVNSFANQNNLVIDLAGSGDMIISNFEGAENMKIDLAGSGDLTINGFEGTEILDINLAGSGDIIANSNVTNLATFTLNLGGSGNYNGFPLSAEDCVVSLSGSGNANLTASNTLGVTIGGSGNVSYKGTPTITQNIFGSGFLLNAN
ncbi:MAG: hypothetical protein ACI976_000269 [Aureispira sp.]|jgi:hypothetical protein